MGKNKGHGGGYKVTTSNNSNLPFVSVCTPTFNRRPFFASTIKIFNNQDYPKDRMEWIIIDDGTDPIEDLVKNHPNVKYYKYDVKMPLGKKRNLMHEFSKGDILVYMDDDDYYPADRVSHAVKMLQKNKDVLCAGSSEMYIYFKHIKKMYQFGPYGPNHATAGTFAFKRELLKNHRYNDDACLAEEKAFLSDYTVPFVQLNPLKTILVFSHEHNTFDKRKLLDMPQDPNNPMVKVSRHTVSDFIVEKDLKNFFLNEIHDLLNNYYPGKPEMKPDVIQQTKILEQKMKDTLEASKVNNTNANNNGQIIINQEGQPPRALNNQEIVEVMKNQMNQLNQMNETLNKLINENNILKDIAEQQRILIDQQNVKIRNFENKLLINDEAIIIS